MRDLTVHEIQEVNGGIAETLAIVLIVSLFLAFLKK